jgi:hypothetical protein
MRTLPIVCRKYFFKITPEKIIQNRGAKKQPKKVGQKITVKNKNAKNKLLTGRKGHKIKNL